MATDVDVYGIIQRIVDILDSDSTLFSATGASGKVRKIDSGAPRMTRVIVETTLPHIWVTTDRTIDTISEPKLVLSNAIKVLHHQLNFKIILVAEEKDGFKVEEVLDDFVKLINQDLTANYDLRDPSSGLTPLVDSSKITSVEELDTAITGLARQGRIIRLRCVKATG